MHTPNHAMHTGVTWNLCISTYPKTETPGESIYLYPRISERPTRHDDAPAEHLLGHGDLEHIARELGARVAVVDA